MMTRTKKYLPLMAFILTCALAHPAFACDADVHIYKNEGVFKKNKGILFEGDVETLLRAWTWTYAADGKYSCEKPKHIRDKKDAACYLCENGTVMCVTPEAAKTLLKK
jgi:hypothetical protein